MKHLFSLLASTFLITLSLFTSSQLTAQAQTTPSAQLTLTPSTTANITPGTDVTVSVKATINQFNAGAVRVNLTYNTAHFDFVSEDAAGSSFPALLSSSTATAGSITLSRGAISKTVTGANVQITNLKFRAKLNSDATSTFTVLNTSKIWISGTGGVVTPTVPTTSVTLVPSLPTIPTFTANGSAGPITVASGDSVEFVWDVTNIDPTHAGHSLQLIGPNLVQDVKAIAAKKTSLTMSNTTSAQATYTYSLKAINTNPASLSGVTKTITVTVKPKNPNFTPLITPNVVRPGQSVTITWQLEDPTTALDTFTLTTVDGDGAGNIFFVKTTTPGADPSNVNIKGTPSYSYSPAFFNTTPPQGFERRRFQLTASNMNGQQTVQKTINLDITPNAAVVDEFKLNGTAGDITLNEGQPVTISWRTTNANSVKVKANGTELAIPTGQTAANGQMQHTPTGNTTYELLALDAVNRVTTATRLLTLNKRPVVSLTATPADNINRDTSISLKWLVSNWNGQIAGHTLIMTGPGLPAAGQDVKSINGTVGIQVTPPYNPAALTATYSLKAVGYGALEATDTASVTINRMSLSFCVKQNGTNVPVAGAHVYPNGQPSSLVRTDNPLPQDNQGYLITGTNGCTNPNFIKYSLLTLANPNYTAVVEDAQYHSNKSIPWAWAGGDKTVDLVVDALAPTATFSSSQTQLVQSECATLNVTVGNYYTSVTLTTLNAQTGDPNGVKLDESTTPKVSSTPLTYEVCPRANKTYKLTVVGPGGTLLPEPTLSIEYIPAPVVDLSASSSSLTDKEGTTLSWSVTGQASSIQFSIVVGTTDTNVEDVPATGTKSVAPRTPSTTYKVKATGIGGTHEDTLTVTYTAPSVSFCVTRLDTTPIAGAKVYPTTTNNTFVKAADGQSRNYLETDAQGCTDPTLIDYQDTDLTTGSTYNAKIEAVGYDSLDPFPWTRTRGVQAPIQVRLNPSAIQITSFAADTTTLIGTECTNVRWAIGAGNILTSLKLTSNESPALDQTLELTATSYEICRQNQDAPVTYTLVARGLGGGDVTRSTQITFIAAPALDDFSINYPNGASDLTDKESATLTWTTRYPIASMKLSTQNPVTGDPVDVELVQNGVLAANYTVTPRRNATYTLTATGPGTVNNQATTKTTTLTYTTPSLSFCVKDSATGNNVVGARVFPNTTSGELIKTGLAAPNNQGYLITGTDGCSNPTFINYDALTTGANYTLKVAADNYSDLTGFAWQRTRGVQTPITVQLDQRAPEIVSFTATPNRIVLGSQSVTLAWNINYNFKSIRISPDIQDQELKDYGRNASIAVTPTQTTDYTLTVVNDLGLFDVASVRVTVDPPVLSFCVKTNGTAIAGAHVYPNGQDNGLMKSNIPAPDNLPYLVTGADGCTNPTFINYSLVGDETNHTAKAVYPKYADKLEAWTRTPGTQRVDIDMTALAPTLTFSATPADIERGGVATLRWQVGNLVDRLTLNPGNINVIGSLDVNGNGTLGVQPATNTTYTLVAEGPGGLSPEKSVAVTLYPAVQIGTVPGITNLPAFQMNGKVSYKNGSTALVSNKDWNGAGVDSTPDYFLTHLKDSGITGPLRALTGNYSLAALVSPEFALPRKATGITSSDHTISISSIVRGNVNSDNAINIIDVSGIMACFGLTSPACLTNQYDYNKDGNVNLADVSLIMSVFNQQGDQSAF